MNLRDFEIGSMDQMITLALQTLRRVHRCDAQRLASQTLKCLRRFAIQAASPKFVVGVAISAQT